VPRPMAPIGGLTIGQAVIDGYGVRSLRVVVIDPDLNVVEAEDSAGTVVIDTIDHFIASHPAPSATFAGCAS